MFSTIVVGVDGRRGGREALLLARRFSGSGGGAVVAVHVYPRPLLRPSELDTELETRAAARALLSEELSLAGVEARSRVVADTSPGRGLHRVADGLRADLIVVGSSHRGPVGRLLAGDTARAVLLGSRRSVAVATSTRRDAPSAPVVGVGYDGGLESRAALDWARRAAEAIGGRMHVLCAAEPPIAFTPAVSYGAMNWGILSPARETYAQRQLDEAMGELDDRATGEVAIGLAREELQRLSEEVDLLVLGSRGYGPVRRTLLGSTSDHLIHGAGCSVVVVPRSPVSADRVADPSAAAARA